MAARNERFIVILCTAPTPDVGAELGRGLVEQRLAACVNVLPGVRSIYCWQGEIHDDPEVQLLIKTQASHFESVAQFIREHHPYDEPEVLALPIQHGSATYLAWLSAQTRSSE